MKVLILTSTHSQTPLAEIRTDGRVLDFIVDNTEGKIPSQVGKSYAALQSLVDSSSHLSLSEPQKPSTALHRYMLDTGDVVEITTDAKTAILNGTIMSDEEKNALFSAIRNGEVSVLRRADIDSPVPVMPTHKPEIKPAATPNGFNRAITEELKEQAKLKQQSQRRASKEYDPAIEQADLRGAEDAKYVKDLLYFLKYGG